LELKQNYSTWEETSNTNMFNFKWKPFSVGIVFDRLSKHGFKQLVNHIEGHASLTTKDELFFNMKVHCERKQLNVFSYLPFSMAVDFNSPGAQIAFD
jgi:hypothetical protein